MLTEEMIQRLMAAGIKRQQAISVTTETLVNVLMREDGKELIAEAKRQVDAMRETVRRLENDYERILEKMEAVTQTIMGVSEAQQQYGNVTEDKAKNLIALYGALLSMNEKMGAEGSESIKSASYIAYAYLGGQAKREISYSLEND